MEKFVHSAPRSTSPQAESTVFYLKDDTWDDFSYKTLFELSVVTPDGKFHRIGGVKIAQLGLQSGRVSIPDEFEDLDETYCSLGQNQNYYEQLASLPDGLGQRILTGLRDCAADPAIWERFRDERAVQVSLLRSISSSFVETTFRDIIQGQAPATPFEFVFDLKPAADTHPPLSIDVKVVPHATPPTNVHVLIGRNGVGKSRMLAGVAAGLTGSAQSSPFAMEGTIRFPGESTESGRFANLVTIAFSAFDRFAPLHEESLTGNIRYAYVGLKQWSAGANVSPPLFKNPDEFAQEFRVALEACLDGPRRYRWNRTLRILSSDPTFAELELEQASNDAVTKFDLEAFQRLSSGHKIVLLSAARLVELVDERTLVLLDEPESHLHPPLLSSFIRALSNLLVLRNGVAIVATHSPVVLQEVPRSCVWVLRRNGEALSAERPTIETFGENVGILTHEVFQLEVTDSGFHRMLADAASSLDYDQIIEKFGSQIGAEGRAIARALTASKQR